MRGEQRRDSEPAPETDSDLGIGEEHDPVAALLANPAMAALIDQAIARRMGVVTPAAGDSTGALLAAIERMTMIHATQAPGYSKPLAADVIEDRRAGFDEMTSLIEICQAEGRRPRYKLVGEPLFAGEIEYLPGSEIATFLIPNEHMAPLNDEARLVHAAMMRWIGGPQMSIAERVEQAERERKINPTPDASPYAAAGLPDQSPVQIVAEPDDVRQFDPRRPPQRQAQAGVFTV